jgi:sugar fermentation stimulation protein A
LKSGELTLKYPNITQGEFVSRPNRFIAVCRIDGREEVCHVKNTGRCRELLTQGCRVYLTKSDNPSRKTAYDLVATDKGGILINMDSQAPNKAVFEWLSQTEPFGSDMEIHPERKYGNSRIDFYLKSKKTDRQIFLEVKGCTLEKDGVVMFPDAPTERGVKHVRELSNCVSPEKGVEAVVFILVQMENVKYFTPNYETHPEFGEALKEAQKKGVTLLCYDSRVTPDSITVGKPVEIRL